MSDNLTKHPVYSIGTASNLVWGCDRELFLMLSLLYAVSALTSKSIVVIAVIAIMFLITLKVLRIIAKSDPLLTRVFINHIHFRKFYPAKSTPFCLSRGFRGK